MQVLHKHTFSKEEMNQEEMITFIGQRRDFLG